MLHRTSMPGTPEHPSDGVKKSDLQQGSIAPAGSSRFSRPLHPLLFAAFPVLNLYSHNIGEVPLHEVWLPLGGALLGTFLAWSLLAFITRHVRKAAIVASCGCLLFFSYGHIKNVLPETEHFLITPFCILGSLPLLFILFRSRGTLNKPTAILNLMAAMLLFPSCLTIGSSFLSKASNRDQEEAIRANLVFAKKGAANGEASAQGYRKLPHPKSITPSEAAKLPDIYYIILDAYGRADTLKTFLGIDNTPFVSALEARGFYVARHSHSNYAQTGYCLPAYLNMNYLEALPHGENIREQPNDVRFDFQRRSIDENAVAAFLRNLGYHYVYIWTGTGLSRVETADLELDDDTLTPPESFAEEVFSLTALAAAPQMPQIKSVETAKYVTHRAFIETAFHNLNSVARLPYPKFVFAHILAPHPPFVFGPNGEAVTPHAPYSEADGSQLLERLTRTEYKRGYTEQLQYINRRVLEAVDAITRQSSHPPIIIIQGDHGSRMNLDWHSQANTNLRESFSILNAYLVPQGVRARLYDTITPVNSFRLLLSTLFGANYPLLPDRSFFATADHPFQFTDVTDQIGQDTNAQSDGSASTDFPRRALPR